MKKLIISNIKKNLLFFIMSAVLMLVLFSLCSLKVYSHSKENRIIADKEMVDQLERSYIKAIKTKLAEYGCEYAGVTMTKVYCETGNEYEVSIHHKNIKYLDEKEMDSLSGDLEWLVQDFQNSNFSFSFSM